MNAIKAENGQGWARAAVAVGAVLSVAGNVTETVLTQSLVHLFIRIVIAAFLPVIVFIAVEVFVRVAWRRAKLDYFGRAVLILLPSFGAAYVSFDHLFSLSMMSGADEVASAANALAIDGLMIGGTVALLAIRAARLAEQTELMKEERDVVDVVAQAEGAVPEPSGSPSALEEQPVAGALLVHGGSESAGAMEERKATRSTMDPVKLEKAVRALIEGVSVKEAAETHGVARSTLGRYGTVRNALAVDPLAEIDCKKAKVQPELVAMMRSELRMERAR